MTPLHAAVLAICLVVLAVDAVHWARAPEWRRAADAFKFMGHLLFVALGFVLSRGF